jgi:hypothetical protein
LVLQAKRELFINDNIAQLKDEGFSDNKRVPWNTLSFEHREHVVNVEAELISVILACPCFKIVVSFQTV